MGHLLFTTGLPKHMQDFLAKKVKMYVRNETRQIGEYWCRYWVLAPGLQRQWTYFHPNGRDALQVDYSGLYSG